MPRLEHLRPSGLHHNPAYSHVVVASGARTIYIAGQVSTDEEGRVVGEGDLAAQTTQVMQNLGLALKAAGASYANIVKIVTFVVGYKPELRPIIGQARSAFFEGMTPPASTLVGVSALAAPEWLIEIEAVAASIDFGEMSQAGRHGSAGKQSDGRSMGEGRHHNRDDLCVPRHVRIASGQIKPMCVTLDRAPIASICPFVVRQ